MDLRNGYAVVDLEMTGDDHIRGLIIEIGVGIKLPSQGLTSDRVLIKIDRPIPKRISALTGITDRDLAAGGISIDDALGGSWREPAVYRWWDTAYSSRTGPTCWNRHADTAMPLRKADIPSCP